MKYQKCIYILILIFLIRYVNYSQLDPLDIQIDTSDAVCSIVVPKAESFDIDLGAVEFGKFKEIGRASCRERVCVGV